MLLAGNLLESRARLQCSHQPNISRQVCRICGSDVGSDLTTLNALFYLYYYTGGPCRFIGPKFEELSKKEEYADIVFAKVDVDEAEDVAADQKIQAMPTFKFFKSGAQVAEMMGADLEKLVSLMSEHK